MTTPPPEPGRPASDGNPPPAGTDWPVPGSPQGWYPPPGYGPQPKPGTNGFAVAALVLAILSFIPLGLIFGVVALSQIKRSGQGGRGLAIAGIVVSALWLLLIGGLIVLGAATSAQPGTVSSRELGPGDCHNDLPAGPCTQPHEGEVFAAGGRTA